MTGVTAVGPASSLSVVFLASACAGAAISCCEGCGGTGAVALAARSGCTLAAKASSPLGAGCGLSAAGGLEVAGKEPGSAARAAADWGVSACAFAALTKAEAAAGEPAGSTTAGTAGGCRLVSFHEDCIRTGCWGLPVTRENDGIQSGQAEAQPEPDRCRRADHGRNWCPTSRRLFRFGGALDVRPGIRRDHGRATPD